MEDVHTDKQTLHTELEEREIVEFIVFENAK